MRVGVPDEAFLRCAWACCLPREGDASGAFGSGTYEAAGTVVVVAVEAGVVVSSEMMLLRFASPSLPAGCEVGGVAVPSFFAAVDAPALPLLPPLPLCLRWCPPCPPPPPTGFLSPAVLAASGALGPVVERFLDEDLELFRAGDPGGGGVARGPGAAGFLA